jgi:BirA family transcriptional regulator, biotin operon repressor / biotin---[acetyl-CoA-carboxylase] ligase
MWREVRVVDTTASTNLDVATAARAGAAEGLVVIAEAQAAGRGRLDRHWESPARAGLLLSALLRPALPPAALPLLPLLAGLAVAEAVRGAARVDAALKWPNDILVGSDKLGGILVERVDGAAVVGIGINVSARAEELPVPSATSIALAGGVADREPLAKEVLRALARRYLDFVDSGGAAARVLPAYREICTTLGKTVTVRRPDGGSTTGKAVAVRDDGRLTVQDAAGATVVFSAGDVEHLRLGPESGRGDSG